MALAAKKPMEPRMQMIALKKKMVDFFIAGRV